MNITSDAELLAYIAAPRAIVPVECDITVGTTGGFLVQDRCYPSLVSAQDTYSLDASVAKFMELVATPESEAKWLRQRAAEMLAKADKLSPRSAAMEAVKGIRASH